MKSNLIRELNFLMGIDTEHDYLVIISFEDPILLELDELKASVIENNPELKINQELVKEAVKEQSQLIILKSKLLRQENDLVTFEDNFSRTQNRFERGLASSLDLREAQRPLFNARLGINDAKLDILKSEAKIRNLTGAYLVEGQ